METGSRLRGYQTFIDGPSPLATSLPPSSLHTHPPTQPSHAHPPNLNDAGSPPEVQKRGTERGSRGQVRARWASAGHTRGSACPPTEPRLIFIRRQRPRGMVGWVGDVLVSAGPMEVVHRSQRMAAAASAKFPTRSSPPSNLMSTTPCCISMVSSSCVPQSTFATVSRASEDDSFERSR